jgi:hypothetical protein
MGTGTYPISFSIVNYFLEQWGLIKIRLVNAIEDSVETNEEVSSGGKPDVMFNQYGRLVELVSKRINDGFKDGSRGKKHCVYSNLFIFRMKEGERDGGITKSFDFHLNSQKENIRKQHVYLNTLW